VAIARLKLSPKPFSTYLFIDRSLAAPSGDRDPARDAGFRGHIGKLGRRRRSLVLLGVVCRSRGDGFDGLRSSLSGEPDLG
jgi:hypothetical protein